MLISFQGARRIARTSSCHLRVSRPLPTEALPRGRIARLLRGEPQTARVNRAKSQATVLLDSGHLPDRPV